MLNQIKKIGSKVYLKIVFLAGNIVVPTLALAQGGGGSAPYIVKNPLRPDIDTLPELVALVLNAVVQIGVPVVALGIIYSGFLFVKAQGNPAELKTAKEAFYWTIIGAMIVLGAFVILGIIEGTVEQLK